MCHDTEIFDLLRYAQTVLETMVTNPHEESIEVTYAVTLPESAFASNFSMILNNDQVLKINWINLNCQFRFDPKRKSTLRQEN